MDGMIIIIYLLNQIPNVVIININELIDFNILSSSSGHLAKSFILEDHFAINLYLKVAILYTITSKVDVEIDGKVVYTSPSLSS